MEFTPGTQGLFNLCPARSFHCRAAERFFITVVDDRVDPRSWKALGFRLSIDTRQGGITEFGTTTSSYTTTFRNSTPQCQPDWTTAKGGSHSNLCRTTPLIAANIWQGHQAVPWSTTCPPYWKGVELIATTLLQDLKPATHRALGIFWFNNGLVRPARTVFRFYLMVIRSGRQDGCTSRAATTWSSH